MQPEAMPGLQPDVALSEDFILLRFVKPIYPEYELQHGVRGHVEVAVLFTPDGEVDEVVVQKSTCDPPSASTNGFELACIEALKQFRVRLPVEYRKSHGYWKTFPIDFLPEEQGLVKIEH
jgi:outer membrane biosynthesis protein TonB